MSSKEENSSVDKNLSQQASSHLGQQQAAVKIQSMQRAAAARKEAEKMRKEKGAN